MALIKREKKEVLTQIRVRMDEGLLAELDQYATHLESSRDHVIAEAVRYIVRRDKEFTDLRQELPQNLRQDPPQNVRQNPERKAAVK